MPAPHSLYGLFALMSSEASTQQSNQRRSPGDYTYLDGQSLQQYVTETGRILPRRITKLSSKHQRHITKIIKQARNLLLMK